MMNISLRAKLRMAIAVRGLAMLVCIASLIPCELWAQGGPIIRLSKQVGPPTTRVKVSGTGFTPNVGVSISFDSIHMSRTQTDGSGSFSGAPLKVPQKASPGDHTVSALDDNGVIAFAPFLVQTDWPQFHFSPVHAGYNPYESVLSPGTVGNLNPVWNALADYAAEFSAPVVAGGSVYFGNLGGGAYALDAKSGALLWTFSTDNDAPFTPAVSGTTVFISDCSYCPFSHSFPAKVYALAASSGNLLWRFPTDTDIVSAPTVANGTVYIAANDTAYALNATTGAQLWSFPLGTPWCCDPATPAVANGVVYVAIDTAYALNAGTGKMLWSQPLPAFALTSITLANGAVYLHLSNDQDIALSQATGAVLWTFDPGSGFYSESSPAATKGLVYVGCRLSLCALDPKTGNLVWSFPTSGTVRSSPAVANGVVYFGNDQGNFYALNAKTGAYLWNYAVGGNLTHSPAVVDGSVYVNGGGLYGGGGSMWAFR